MYSFFLHLLTTDCHCLFCNLPLQRSAMSTWPHFYFVQFSPSFLSNSDSVSEMKQLSISFMLCSIQMSLVLGDSGRIFPVVFQWSNRMLLIFCGHDLSILSSLFSSLSSGFSVLRRPRMVAEALLG